MPQSASLISGAGGILLSHPGSGIIYIFRWGGTGQGKFRTYINLMITMLLGGLWHGANWTFVVWGALHGGYLWVEKLLRDIRKKSTGVPAFAIAENKFVKASFAPEKAHAKSISNFVLALLTFFLVNVTWVFFRSGDFTSAWRMLHSMFVNNSTGAPVLSYLDGFKVTIIIIALVIAHWLMRNTSALAVANKMPWWPLGIVWSLMLLLIALSQNASSSFIYFQF